MLKIISEKLITSHLIHQMLIKIIRKWMVEILRQELKLILNE